jgi:hypothetical protein
MTSDQSLLANCSERPDPRIYQVSSHHKKEGAIETYGRAVAIDGKKLWRLKRLAIHEALAGRTLVQARPHSIATLWVSG